MLLQRKLQEGKLLREQKKKLQQQKEENEQKLKESHDRQTPFMTSPSIQQVLKSPAKRLFEEGNRTKSVQDKSDIPRSQSVVMVQQNRGKQERSKSISEVDVEMAGVDSEKNETFKQMEKKSKTKVPLIESRQGTSIDNRKCYQIDLESRQGTNIDSSKCYQIDQSHRKHTEKHIDQEKENTQHQINQSESRLTQSESRLTQSENKTSDEVDGNRPVNDNVVYMEIETEKSSSPLHHVIRKPSLISANFWNIPASTEGHMKSIVPSTIIDNSVGCDSIKQLLNNKGGSNDSTALINSTNHSSRSAFVPFSQIQSRKDPMSDLCKNPSINLTQNDGQIYITVPNNFDMTKLPSHCLEQISSSSQLMMVNGPPPVVDNSVKDNSRKIAFQPVLQSEVIAASNLVTPVSNSQTQVTDDKVNQLANSCIIERDKLSNLNHHFSHGKFIVPAKLTGNSGIVHGQGTVHEIENKLNPVTSTAQTFVIPVNGDMIAVNGDISPAVDTVCSQLLKQMAKTTGIAVQSKESSYQSQPSGNTHDMVTKNVLSNSSSIKISSTCYENIQQISNSIPIISNVINPQIPSNQSHLTTTVVSTKQLVSLTTASIQSPVLSSKSSSVAIVNTPNGSNLSSSFTVVNSTPTTLCSVVPEDNSIPLLTPPSTPKKSTKSRFAPIRPKASPVKTLSSILKDTKITPPEVFVYDKSKPVSELLKEKRAREAELALKSKQNSGVPSTTGTVNIDISCNQGSTIPQLCSTLSTEKNVPVSVGGFLIPAERSSNMKNMFAVGLSPKEASNTFLTNGEMLSKLQSGQMLSGLVGQSGDVVYVINHVSHSSPKSSNVRPNSLNLSADQNNEKKIKKQKAVESPDLNDDDTMDIEDVLKMYVKNEHEVTNQTPSKLAKMEDENQTVHSRPGSRCSADVETQGGRKRKFYNAESASRSFGRKRLNSGDDFEDDVVHNTLEESQENRRESRSCTFEMENSSRNNQMISSAIKLNKHQPDISMLEIDALIDLVQPDQPCHVQPKKKVNSTAVGVNSLSLRKSQQQLLKEKPMLDERISSFLQKKAFIDFGSGIDVDANSDENNDRVIGELLNMEIELGGNSNKTVDDPSLHLDLNNYIQPEQEGMLQRSTGFTLPPHMDDESDLPKDVADFITDVLTAGIAASDVNEKVLSLEYENLSKQDSNKQSRDHTRNQDRSRTVCHNNQMVNLQQRLVSQSSQGSIINKTSISRVVDRSSNIGEGNFASPQRPAGRRQRTPSVERITSQITSNSSMDRRSVPTPTLFPSPIHCAVTRRRETSIDRMTNQTPYSDPGYGSIGASPVLNPTPVSQSVTCDTSANSGHNSSLVSTRADSAQSVTSDVATFSPVSLASPRFQTSTPYPLRSPCSSRNILQSPIEAVGQSFIPIQGSQLQIDSNVTLIKPVVTVASSQSNQSSVTTQAKEQNKLRKDLIGIGSILPRTELNQTLQKQPPSYSDAMLSQFKSSGKTDLNRGAFDVPLLRSDQTSSEKLHEGESEQSLSFSYKLAMMSTKYGGQKTTNLHNRSLPEHLLHSSDLLQNILPQEDQEKSIQIESIKANLQNTGPLGRHFIPDYNDQDFIRGQNLSQRKVTQKIKGDHVLDRMIEDDVEFMAKRNLSVDLEHSTSFNEDDLETTLEDLKSLDSQYFTQDNLMNYQRQ